ncbi:MAG: hypothetical protein E6G19_07210 [Actinobacteria bacterium]|nr:MAG: hypothetical protein E6G19_07210 [Actinomycetota bacterium]
MRLPKLVTVALATAALAASSATADPGHGKPTGPDSQKCKPANVKLMGTLTSDPGASDTSFTMTVLKANHAGQAFKLAGSATVNVDAKTRIHRHAAGVHGNKATIGDLALGDYAKVKARVCKADLATNATPDLTAQKIDAHAPKTPKAAEPAKADENG